MTVATLESRVQEVLDTIRPYLNGDGGDVELVEIDETQVVKLRLLGACSSCDMSMFTMKAGIEESIMRSIPEIKGVVAI